MPPPRGSSVAFFLRSLAALFDAGISLNRGLELLGRQADDPRMAAVSRLMAAQVDRGSMLSAAMAEQNRTFADLQTRLTQIGERTGSLDLILKRLASYEEKRVQLNLKVRSALTYPAFVAILTLGMLMIVPPFLFQGLFQMIEGAGVEVPLITRVVLTASKLVRNPLFFVVVAAGAGALIWAWPRWMRQPRFRYQWFKLLLSLPGVGQAVRIVAVSRFSRAMALQLHVGENIMSAMTLSGEAASDPLLIEGLQRSVEAMKQGASVVEALRRADYFPPAYLHVLSAGEESGRLAFMMEKITVIYEAELESSLEMFTALLEPLVMLAMGIIVGVVVVATMLPMMQLLQRL